MLGWARWVSLWLTVCLAPSCAGSEARAGEREGSRTSPAVAIDRPVVLAARSVAPAASWTLERVIAERAIAEDDLALAPAMDEAGPVLRAGAPVSADLSTSGAHLDVAGHRVTLRLAAVGREVLTASATSAPRIDGHRVALPGSRGASEWWRALPSGLEHGIDVAARPWGRGALRLQIAVTGLRPVARSEDAVALVDGSGAHVATYGGLFVIDADGTTVPARMSVEGDLVVLTVDDERARYPLVIDPLVTAEEAALVAATGSALDGAGRSVSMTSDGSRVVVGAPGDDTVTMTGTATNGGSIQVWARSGATWASELFLGGTQAQGALGTAVAISGDGSRLLIAAYLADLPGPIANAGTAFAYTRTGTSWAYDGTLSHPSPSADDWFGHAVALSEDGSRAILGASQDATTGGVGSGSAIVFLRTAGSWTAEATLVAAGAQPNDGAGSAVALSADGALAVVGARVDDDGPTRDTGCAIVYARAGTTWTEQTVLRHATPATGDAFGDSVAVSGDGTRIAVGAYNDDAPTRDLGSVTVFVNVAGSWVREATLTASDAEIDDRLGQSVALSADGSRLVVGVGEDDTPAVDAGSARVFVRDGSAWADEATLIAPDAASSDFAGRSVAMSSTGDRVVLAISADDTARGVDSGSARVFTLALATTGSSCGVDAACTSGFCVDGVCCATRCDGDGLCQGCSAARTGGADGTCAPLSAAGAAATRCRDARGDCDAPEICRAGIVACPADVLYPTGRVCRATPTGATCDVAETCTGLSDACPEDGVASVGAVCRAAAGACDVEETCDGTTSLCPMDASEPATSVCRPSAGACDLVERCTGDAVACPEDLVLSSGSVCRGSGGPCDVEEACTGESPVCPTDVVRGSSVTCRPALTLCDVAEVCPGIGVDCPPDLFASPSTECRASSGEICDQPDHCTGTSADCDDTFRAGFVCREAATGCDAPEACTGGSPACPPDVITAAGVTCRGSTAACDPAEACDGASASCPSDVNACEMPDGGPLDGGPRDGGPRDAGADGAVTEADGGEIVTPAASCACRAGRGSWGLTIAAAAPLAWLLRRRRR